MKHHRNSDTKTANRDHIRTIKHDDIVARENGEKAYDEFRISHLQENASKDFYERQSKLQLTTFSDLKR